MPQLRKDGGPWPSVPRWLYLPKGFKGYNPRRPGTGFAQLLRQSYGGRSVLAQLDRIKSIGFSYVASAGPPGPAARCPAASLWGAGGPY
jgi:hypothetical protein